MSYSHTYLIFARGILNNLQVNGVFEGLPRVEDCEALIPLTEKRLNFETEMRLRFGNEEARSLGWDGILTEIRE